MNTATVIAERLTYRPNWRFVAEGTAVRMSFVGPNTLGDGDIELDVVVDLDGFNLQEGIWELRRRIELVEHHERAEWLRFDGWCVDPEARRAHPGQFPPIDWDSYMKG